MAEKDQPERQQQPTGKPEPGRTDDTVEDLELVREEGEDVKGGQKKWADATSP